MKVRVNYQALLSKKDPTPYLERWAGGNVALWYYVVSHRLLELRVTIGGRSGRLSIYCGDVVHFHGPTKWSNCDIELERPGPDEVILLDRKAGVVIRAADVGVEEGSDLLS